MTVYFSGGALKIAKPDGTIRFDSNQGLFHGTNYLASSFGLGSYEAITTYSGGSQLLTSLVDTSTDDIVAAVDAGATHCIGFMRTAWPSGSPEFDGIWRDASGTHVDSWDSLDVRSSPDANDWHYYMGSISLMTFYVSGGNLRFKERIILRADNAVPSGPPERITRPAITVHYRILAGYFL